MCLVDDGQIPRCLRENFVCLAVERADKELRRLQLLGDIRVYGLDIAAVGLVSDDVENEIKAQIRFG